MLVPSAETAAMNGFEVGDVLQVRLGRDKHDWLVIGLYRWLAGSNYAFEPVYAPLETVRDITQSTDMASFLVLDAATANEIEEAAYIRALKRILKTAVLVSMFAIRLPNWSSATMKVWAIEH